MKAYEISTSDSDQGTCIVFCDSSNRAKIKGQWKFDVPYIEVRAKREPLMDKYWTAAIDDELRWGFAPHRKILIEELGYQEL